MAILQLDDTDWSDADVQKLLLVGRKHGKTVGLHDRFLDDCAITFVEKLLARNENAELVPIRCLDQAHLNTIARNHAIDVRRAINRLLQMESPLSIIDGCAMCGSAVLSTSLPDLGSPFIRQDIVSRVQLALDALDAERRQLFIRHHIDCERIQSIAISMGQPPHVIAQRIYRIRLSLRTTLLRGGVTETDVLDAMRP